MAEFSTLLRTPSTTVSSDSSRTNVIQAFIIYVKSKGISTANNSNIVSKLIEVMNRKTMFGNIDLASNVLPLYNKMFDIKVNRPEIFDILKTWCPKLKKMTINAESLRKLTVYSNLSEITRRSDPNPYTRDSNSIDVSIGGIDLGDKEINFCQEIWPDLGIQRCKKYQCGICWICDEPIYLFYATYGKSKKLESGFLNGSCGEDEHTIAAGQGNMYGTLSSDIVFSKSIVTDKKSLMNLGLRASHTWCNRCKSDLSFVNPPQLGAGYTLNYSGILTFKQMAQKWMTDANIKHFSNEVQFSKFTTLANRTDVVKKMEKTIVEKMTILCNMANSLVATPSSSGNDIYTAFLLRMIWNGCLLCTRLFDPKQSVSYWKEGKKKGGKYQYGGNKTDADEVFNDFFEIISQPISDRDEESSSTLEELDSLFFPDGDSPPTGNIAAAVIGIHNAAIAIKEGKKTKLSRNEAEKRRIETEAAKLAATRVKANQDRDARAANRAADNDARNAAAASVSTSDEDNQEPTVLSVTENMVPATEDTVRRDQEEKRQIENDKAEVLAEIEARARAAGDNINNFSEQIIKKETRGSSKGSQLNTFFVESKEIDTYSLVQKGNKGNLCNNITGACTVIFVVAAAAAKGLGYFGGKKTKNNKNKNKMKTKKQTKKRRTKNHKMKTKKQTRKRRTKGGELQLDDQYKNNEGSQF